MDIPSINDVIDDLQRGIDEIDFGGVKLPKPTDGGNIMIQTVNKVAGQFGLELPLTGASGSLVPSFPSSLPSLPKLPARAAPLTIPKVLGGV